MCPDNEAAALGEMHARLTTVLQKLAALKSEIIYVDDGSTDETPQMLRDLQAIDSNVRVLSLFNPKGVVPSSPGVAASATLGKIYASVSNPKGVVSDAPWMECPL